MTKRIALIGLLILGGCAVGPNIKRQNAAITHSGVKGIIEVGSKGYSGELLTGTDTSLIMLMPPARLVEIPHRIVTAAKFKPFVHRSRAPAAHEFLKLRHASRFPFGIPQTVLASLLDRAGQTQIQLVAP